MGRKHKIQVSTSNADGSGAGHDTDNNEETTNLAFNLQTGHNTIAPSHEFYSRDQEAGQTTHLIDAVASISGDDRENVPTALSWNKSLSMVADEKSLPFWMYYATHGGVAATGAAQLDDTGVYAQQWLGPSTGAVRAFTAVDLGDPAADDSDYGKVLPNCVAQRVTLSGERKGILTIDADIICGGEVFDADGTNFVHANDGVTPSRLRLFNFGQVMLGQVSGALSAFPTNDWFDFPTASYSAPPTFAEMQGLGKLRSTSNTDLSTDLMSFSVTIEQNIDPIASYSPGNVAAVAVSSGTAYPSVVKWSDDWVYSNTAQEMTLDLTFRQGSATKGLRQDFETGGTTAWNLVILHPDPQSAGTNDDSYYGMYLITKVVPVPGTWAEENNGFGERFVSCQYKSIYIPAHGYGWSINVGTSIGAQLGA
jgi:hypothetical protein